MTMPPRIRVNASAPFPALVTGANAVGIGKQNGIWTVGLNTMALAAAAPPLANYPTDYIIVYDSIAGNYVRVSLSSFTGISTFRNQRSLTAADLPIMLASTDQILNCNINTTASCTLPSAASRLGSAVTFKDVGAQFGAHPLTLSPTGADLIEGASSLVLNVNRQSVTLVPMNDGVNAGWWVMT